MAVQKTHYKTKGVAIPDLDAFRNDLRRLVREGGTDGLALLKGANYRVAEHVRTKAMTKAEGVGRQSARAASTLRSSRTSVTSRLTLGNARVPFAEGAEFGTLLGERRNVGGWNSPRPGIGWLQFRDKDGALLQSRPHGRTGYFLFPTMRAESEEIKEMYVRELDDICKIAFPHGRL